jgi:hypothetical protein
MSRNIPNKPHPTPDPEKLHSVEGSDPRDFAVVRPGSLANSAHSSGSADDLALDELTYDSCHDDLNQVLSQSMEQPDPDPLLESSAGGVEPADASGPKRAPRTSEVFRAVAISGDIAARSSGSGARPDSDDIPAEVTVPGLEITDRGSGSSDSSPSSEGNPESKIPWGQIALLSYSSALTFGLIWMFWTGRVPRRAEPAAAPSSAEKTALDSAFRSTGPDSVSPAPPLPKENFAAIGKTVRLGDLEVTPVSIEAMPVELVRTIDPGRRRREDKCLVLRLRLTNRSNDQTFVPIDRTLVRERDFRPYDPYIVGSHGETIRLFPLAIDSEWSIHGQKFPMLHPGDSAETFIAAEPGAADRVAEEMTWRVRLRIGVYRSDMLGVQFSRSDVRYRRPTTWDDDE